MIKRIRGRALQRIRADYRAAEPLCVECKAEGRIAPWTELDHVEALGLGGADVAANRRGLCKHHHEAKSRDDLAKMQGRA